MPAHVIDLCLCGHPRTGDAGHDATSCEGLDSYGCPCACPSFLAAPALDLDGDDLPGDVDPELLALLGDDADPLDLLDA